MTILTAVVISGVIFAFISFQMAHSKVKRIIAKKESDYMENGSSEKHSLYRKLTEESLHIYQFSFVFSVTSITKPELQSYVGPLTEDEFIELKKWLILMHISNVSSFVLIALIIAKVLLDS